MQPDTLAIPLELVNRVLGYLSTKPYNEVAQLINDIQTNARALKQPEQPAATIEEVAPPHP